MQERHYQRIPHREDGYNLNLTRAGGHITDAYPSLRLGARLLRGGNLPEAYEAIDREVRHSTTTGNTLSLQDINDLQRFLPVERSLIGLQAVTDFLGKERLPAMPASEVAQTVPLTNRGRSSPRILEMLATGEQIDSDNIIMRYIHSNHAVTQSTISFTEYTSLVRDFVQHTGVFSNRTERTEDIITTLRALRKRSLPNNGNLRIIDTFINLAIRQEIMDAVTTIRMSYNPKTTVKAFHTLQNALTLVEKGRTHEIIVQNDDPSLNEEGRIVLPGVEGSYDPDMIIAGVLTAIYSRSSNAALMPYITAKGYVYVFNLSTQMYTTLLSFVGNNHDDDRFNQSTAYIKEYLISTNPQSNLMIMKVD